MLVIPKKALLATALFFQLVVANDEATISREDFIEDDIHSQIVGGVKVTDRIYPWVGSMQGRTGGHSCGGSLIKDKWFLTAAHCIFPGQKYVEFGQYDITEKKPEKGSERVKIKKMIKHPQYDPSEMTNDIALVELSRKLPKRETIKFNTDDSNEDSGTDLQVIGWGALKYQGEASGDLMHVVVDAMTNKKCNQNYKSLGWKIYDNMICAARAGKDSCQGDSGGPLFVGDSKETFRLVGVVSFGQGCAHKKYPGVYTNARKYIEWAESVVGELDNATPAPSVTPAPTLKPTIATKSPTIFECSTKGRRDCVRKFKKVCKWNRRERTCEARESKYPTAYPSKAPTNYPTARPTHYPTAKPSASPTSSPTDAPTESDVEYEYEYEEYEEEETQFCDEFQEKDECLQNDCKWDSKGEECF